MAFCLLPQFVDKFKSALLRAEITPDKLNNMSSLERRTLLEKYIGKENSKEVNLLIEKKLLLKHGEQGLVRAIQDILGINDKVKSEMIIKAKEELQRKQDRIFKPGEGEKVLEELASDIYSRKYRTEISLEESQTVTDLSSKIAETKAKITPEMPNGSKERLEYGLSHILLQKYVGDLKLQAKSIPLKEYRFPKNWGKALYETAGFFKSTMASMDMSFFGTQGIKILYTDPKSWVKQLGLTAKNAGKQLIAKGEWWKSGNDAVMDMIKAEAYSRQNALNGKYQKMKLDIGIASEEAFPTSLPEHIPLVGRVFKASEVAFNGPAIRMRVDLADKMIKKAEKNGKDMLDKADAEGVGSLVNAMTGRGSLGRFEPVAKEINATLFSGKFLASNIHTLTSHLFDKKANRFVKKQAAYNLIRIIGGITATNALLSVLYPGSVETDPRGSNFGVVIINGKRFDTSGKMLSLVRVASRLTPTWHNGELGFWSKNSKGEWSKLNDAKYGASNAFDVFTNFWAGKLSPMAGLLRDIWSGSNMIGEKVTLQSAIKGVLTPMGMKTIIDLKKSDDTTMEKLGWYILDALGGGVQVIKTTGKKGILSEEEFYSKLDELSLSSGKKVSITDWNEIKPTQKQLTQFKDSLSESEFNIAKEEYIKLLSENIQSVLDGNNDDYNALDNDIDKMKFINNIDTQTQKEVFNNWSFEYEKEIK